MPTVLGVGQRHPDPMVRKSSGVLSTHLPPPLYEQSPSAVTERLNVSLPQGQARIYVLFEKQILVGVTTYYKLIKIKLIQGMFKTLGDYFAAI